MKEVYGGLYLGSADFALILLCLLQSKEFPAEAVSRLPSGAGHPAGVGERGATSANH